MQKAKILIVDDDQAVRAVLSAIVSQIGYAATQAASVRGALEVVNAQAIELIIADLRMPDGDGLLLLRQTKHFRPELPVIMLTAHGNVPIAVQAMREGASDFLLKPFERSEIIATIQRAIAKANAPAAPAEPARALEHSEPAATLRRCDESAAPLKLDVRLREAERKALQAALRRAGGNRTLAAHILGISRRTFYNKLAEHDMDPREQGV